MSPSNRNVGDAIAVQVYRTWEEFMYEILSDVPQPSNKNSGAATDINWLNLICFNLTNLTIDYHLSFLY